MPNHADIPVITIDGPSGTGKGTLAALLSTQLKWHLLDSGSLYRAVAWVIIQKKWCFEDATALIEKLRCITIEWRESQKIEEGTPRTEILCNGQSIDPLIRTESCGKLAAKIAKIPELRAYLLAYQRLMRRAPGLVADGRDMGSKVFDDALLKFYLEAHIDIRAKRRHQQLKARGISVSLAEIRRDLVWRDEQDKNRSIAPMTVTSDMVRVDTSDLTVNQTLSFVMAILRQKLEKELTLSS